ncbi:type VI secretion system tip protein TssI/VgrG [Escherichia coli]|nr:type VI secretion system tip protein TssI/VgrG [Escherichia coli]MBM0564303.1 type VI secretion system tip protein VgrG [Escherichia coli]MCF3310202.1 type VI secretion system tip protein VgrG [Escherichia coli]MCU8843656.1 type VI secretion system tip protein VgrG [Escherichia coli]MDC9706028.1 type VI secretion system tip protein TssI/VgrG [Escherichia coli]MDZ8606646.1 type VI secretion system tip protein TssI/VgrG [Escherichia coli]
MSTGLRFTLEVDGLPPDAFAVVSFHLNQSLSSLFSLDLSLVSQQFLSLEFAQVLDKMAYLTIWQGDEVQRRVKGVVTWFELGENDKNQMLYSMKVHPPLWRAGLRQNFRIFQNEDIKSILGTMLQENGVTEWSPLFSEPHPSREFCVQYGETDYDFLCRMAAEEGIFFYEEHAYKSTDQSLVLCDTVRHLPESFEIPWNPNTRTEVSTLCISQFRYSAQIRPSSVVTKDYTFKRPGWAGRFEQEGQHQDYQRTQYEVYDYPGRFKSAHGQNFARWQMDGWRNNAETARGMSRSPEIWPGRRIVLTGHPQANLNREWQVVASELHGEQPQAVPGRQGAGTALENHFAVIPADRTWRPQPLLKPLVDGPQSAVVTGPAGEEIFCDEHGRVRVKFNWDRYNPADQDSSCWIRVAQAWAGTGFGHLAIPRVGQEVIVDFLNGDPDQPIIMGRTYHQENRTPGSLPGTKTQMTIRSKTYMGSGFNELKFDDATGREQVYIHAQKNMDVGTGFYLTHVPESSLISLMDLNEASLNAASTRAGESKIKHKISHDVFEPYPAALHGQFDSISMFYLLHCLPGNISTKSCVIRNAAQALTDDGTLYGATILGDGVVHNSFGQKLMRIYNQKGIFSNTKDSEEGLTHILSEHFENVKTKVQGTVVMFSASGKK